MLSLHFQRKNWRRFITKGVLQTRRLFENAKREKKEQLLGLITIADLFQQKILKQWNYLKRIQDKLNIANHSSRKMIRELTENKGKRKRSNILKVEDYLQITFHFLKKKRILYSKLLELNWQILNLKKILFSHQNSNLFKCKKSNLK